jgi:hypothetical protein
MASSEHEQRPGLVRSLSDDSGQELAVTPPSSQPVTPRTPHQPFHLANIAPNFSPGIRSSVQSGYFTGDASERSSIVEANQPGTGFSSNSPSILTRDSFMSPPARPTSAYQFLHVTKTPPKFIKPSTMLTSEIEKPWRSGKSSQKRIAYWITYAAAALGVVVSVLQCYFAWKSVPILGNLCPIMDEEFETLNTDIWSHDVDLGGYGCVIPFYPIPHHLPT